MPDDLYLHDQQGPRGHLLVEPDPLVTCWPVLEAAASPDGDGAWLLEAGGRVLFLRWEQPAALREVAPPLPWVHAQQRTARVPHRHESEARLLPLPHGRALRFVSTSTRRVRTPGDALLQLLDITGRVLRERTVRGAGHRLLGADRAGAKALVGVPGALQAHPWHTVEVLLEPLQEQPALPLPPLDLHAATSSGLDASQGASSGDGTHMLLARDGRLTLVSRGVARPWDRLTARWWSALALSHAGEWAALCDDQSQLMLARTCDGHLLWRAEVPRRQRLMALQIDASGQVVGVTADGVVHRWHADGSHTVLAVLSSPLPEQSSTASAAAIAPGGASVIVAWGRALVRCSLVGERHLIHTFAPRFAPAVSPARLDLDAQRAHLPPLHVTSDGHWSLRCKVDWEMVDAYQSADVWLVAATPQRPEVGPHPAGERCIRLPEQPWAWGPEPAPDTVLLQGMQDGWMVLHLALGTAARVTAAGQSARVVLCGAHCVRRGKDPWPASESQPATLELVDLTTLQAVLSCPCGRADTPLAATPDGVLVLTLDGPHLRVVRLTDGHVCYAGTLLGDEADEASSLPEAGFLVTTRRGAQVLIPLVAEHSTA